MIVCVIKEADGPGEQIQAWQKLAPETKSKSHIDHPNVGVWKVASC